MLRLSGSKKLGFWTELIVKYAGFGTWQLAVSDEKSWNPGSTFTCSPTYLLRQWAVHGSRHVVRNVM